LTPPSRDTIDGILAGVVVAFTNPTYSVRVKWAATPKVIFEALLAESVTPPQNIVADFERTRQESLTVSYLFSPKVTFAWTVGLSTLRNPTVSGINQSPVCGQPEGRLSAT